MIPNPDIWGAPSTWETGSSVRDWGRTNEIIGGKFAVFDSSKQSDDIARYSIDSGITANKLIRGESFDTSCCPWRIKGDSYWISGRKKLFLPLHGSDTALQLYTDEVTARGCPVMLSTYPSTSYNTYPKLTNINKIWTPAPQGAGITTDIETTPLLKFDYSKILLRCFVAACRYQDDTSSRIFGVDNYYENQASTYPYIRSLVFDVYVNNAGTWQQLDYQDFNIIPVNATIMGFEAESITAFNEDFTVISDGINGNTMGGTDQTGIIRYYSDERGDTESECFYNSYSRNSSIRYAAAPDDWTHYTRVSSGNFYFSMYKENVPKEWVMEQFAALGFWFYTGGAPAVDLSAPDEHTHIPLFDEYGTTTGEYLSGTSALTAPAAEWTDDVFERDIYHGEPPYDPSHYDTDNKTIFNTVSIQNRSQNVYVFTQTNSYDPLTYLYATSFDSADAQFAVKNFLSVSPIDCVQSVMFFPINIVSWVGATEYIFSSTEAPEEFVVYGNVTSEIKANKLTNRTAILDMGYIDIYRKFNDFRDFEPYTSIMLYVPFCGYTQIDCSTFMGKKLKIKYIIDFVTGGCTACILADNLCVQTVNGQMGVQIPVTGAQTAQIRQAFDAAQLQYKQSQMSTAASIAGLTIGIASTIATQGATAPMLAMAGTSAISTLTGAQKAEQRLDFELSHMTTPFKTVGGTSPAVGFQMELTPRAIITRPKMLPGYNAEVYGSTNGYACCSTGKLSQYSGYTQCASVVLDGINATADEKVMLNTLMLKGVIL